MPLPIWPAPITPTVRMLVSVMVSSPMQDLAQARAAWPIVPTQMSAALLAQFGRELRQNLEKIADQPVISDLEDRRLLVLVDGDDHLGILHPGEVLDGAGNADRDVELGRHHFAGLADLPVVRRIAGVDRGAR